jgi:Trypsin-like peptidase domain
LTTPIDIASTVTAKLQVYFREQVIGQATGFFVQSGRQLFLITNWHVVAGRHSETKKKLHAAGAIPDRLLLRVGVHGDPGQWLSPSEVLLYEDADETSAPEQPRWREHPVHGDKLDVVAIPFETPEHGYVRTIDAVDTMPNMYLPVGSDVFVLGYPQGLDGGGEFPIYKSASIATEPGVHRGGPPHILIDTATSEGMSGAPVIGIRNGAIITPGSRTYRFVGVYSSRLGKDALQAQLGTVWAPQLVKDIVQVGVRGRSSFLEY